jgi:hypothetical protein
MESSMFLQCCRNVKKIKKEEHFIPKAEVREER